MTGDVQKIKFMYMLHDIRDHRNLKTTENIESMCRYNLVKGREYAWIWASVGES